MELTPELVRATIYPSITRYEDLLQLYPTSTLVLASRVKNTTTKFISKDNTNKHQIQNYPAFPTGLPPPVECLKGMSLHYGLRSVNRQKWLNAIGDKTLVVPEYQAVDSHYPKKFHGLPEEHAQVHLKHVGNPNSIYSLYMVTPEDGYFKVKFIRDFVHNTRVTPNWTHKEGRHSVLISEYYVSFDASGACSTTNQKNCVSVQRDGKMRIAAICQDNNK